MPPDSLGFNLFLAWTVVSWKILFFEYEVHGFSILATTTRRSGSLFRWKSGLHLRALESDKLLFATEGNGRIDTGGEKEKEDDLLKEQRHLRFAGVGRYVLRRPIQVAGTVWLTRRFSFPF